MNMPEPTHYRLELTAREAQVMQHALSLAARRSVLYVDDYRALIAKLREHPYYADDERECCKYAPWQDVEGGRE